MVPFRNEACVFVTMFCAVNGRGAAPRICPGGTVEFVQDFFVILSRNSVGREVTSWTINCRLSRIFCDFVQDFCRKGNYFFDN